MAKLSYRALVMREKDDKKAEANTLMRIKTQFRPLAIAALVAAVRVIFRHSILGIAAYARYTMSQE